MVGGLLVDAGPLVALFNRRDRHHARCVEVAKSLRGTLCTTWAPLVEAMHLLAFSATAQFGLLQMLEREALRVLPLGVDDVGPIRQLMGKYADLPMDFADATLVRVAGRDGYSVVFTLDQRDFSVYRRPDGTPLRVVPE